MLMKVTNKNFVLLIKKFLIKSIKTFTIVDKILFLLT